jgi:hypothetical protein
MKAPTVNNRGNKWFVHGGEANGDSGDTKGSWDDGGGARGKAPAVCRGSDLREYITEMREPRAEAESLAFTECLFRSEAHPPDTEVCEESQTRGATDEVVVVSRLVPSESWVCERSATKNRQRPHPHANSKSRCEQMPAVPNTRSTREASMYLGRRWG